MRARDRYSRRQLLALAILNFCKKWIKTRSEVLFTIHKETNNTRSLELNKQVITKIQTGQISERYSVNWFTYC